MNNQMDRVAKFRKEEMRIAEERRNQTMNIAKNKFKVIKTIKRNDRCYCNSGRKYKVCCWERDHIVR